MRKRKGAALPSAVALCTFLLVVSFAVSYLVVETITIAKLAQMENQNELVFSTAHNEFVVSGGNLPADTSIFHWEEYHDEGDDTIKALVGYVKADNEMKFYSIYDFTNNKLLAYQTTKFYITSEIVGNKTTYYLAGMIPYREVIA